MRRRWLAAAMVAVVCLLAWASAPVWLTASAWLLVTSERPAPSDAILVLAGDFRGQRLLTACDLLRQGLAPVILVTGPMEWFGTNEADAAVAFGAKHGCETARLKPVYIKAHSTVEEASLMLPELKRLGVLNLIVVTSNFHSARAARVCRRVLGNDMRVTMVASPDEYFEPSRWWKTREGQKTVFFEVSKTIAYMIGL